MRVKIADGARGLSFPGEWKKIRAIFEGAGNNFKPSSLILRLRVASAHLASEKNPFREKFCITAACADGWTSYVERRRRSDIFMSGKMQSNEYMWPFFSCHVCCKNSLPLNDQASKKRKLRILRIMSYQDCQPVSQYFIPMPINIFPQSERIMVENQ